MIHNDSNASLLTRQRRPAKTLPNPEQTIKPAQTTPITPSHIPTPTTSTTQQRLAKKPLENNSIFREKGRNHLSFYLYAPVGTDARFTSDTAMPPTPPSDSSTGKASNPAAPRSRLSKTGSITRGSTSVATSSLSPKTSNNAHTRSGSGGIRKPTATAAGSVLKTGLMGPPAGKNPVNEKFNNLFFKSPVPRVTPFSPPSYRTN